MKFDELGREVPDDTPLELPFGVRRPESLTEMIQRMIRTDVSRVAEAGGAETFDEANDFEMDDDDAELAPTHHELHEEVVNEAARVRRELREKSEQAVEKGVAETPDSDGPPADPGRTKKPSQSLKKKTPRPEPEGDEEQD